MERKSNKHNVPLANKLRKNMTKEEKHLWYDFLSKHPIKFYRQKVFGKYILDFYCAKAKLVIELDGSQHGTPECEQYDEERTQYLREYSLEVLRIPNYQVQKSFYDVCRYINSIIEKRMC